MFQVLNTSGDIPTRRGGHSTVVYHNTLYVLGGQDGSPHKEFYKLSLDTMTWTQLENPLNIVLDGHLAAVWQKKMYVFSGFNGKKDTNTLYSYNFDTNHWEVLRPKNSVFARSYCMGCLYKNCLLFFGGEYGPLVLSDLTSIDLSTLEITQLDRQDQLARACGSAFVHHDSFFMYGGYTSKKTWSNGLYEYNIRDGYWKSWEFPNQLPPCGGMTSSLVCSDKVFLFGGFDGHDEVSEVKEMDMVLKTWKPVNTKGPIPSRCDHTTCVVNTSLYILGGSDSRYVDFYRLDLDLVGTPFMKFPKTGFIDCIIEFGADDKKRKRSDE